MYTRVLQLLAALAGFVCCILWLGLLASTCDLHPHVRSLASHSLWHSHVCALCLLQCPQCILRQLLATADAVCQARAANDTAAAAALQLFMDSLTVTSEDVDAWAAAGAAAEPAVVAPVLISSFNALHPVHGEPGISRSLWKAQMFSGILPASKRDTLAQALLGPVSWPKAGSGSWWAVHAAVLCQDVASLKLLLRLGASASQPVPKPFCEPLMQLLESDRDASRTMLTPLWLCLPLRSEGAAAGPTAMCTASGRAYDMARMAQIVCVLKDHGACISELQPCSLETLEQLADNCGAGVIGLLQALLEPRGPNRQRCWEERLLISAALEGRWRLLQRMLAAQPHQSFSTMQCLAVNAAKAGHIKLLELCLARVATKHLPGVAYETLKDTVLGLGCNAMAERQVSCAVIGLRLSIVFLCMTAACVLPPHALHLMKACQSFRGMQACLSLQACSSLQPS
jgi:hypothetical protein